ncbi:hypothetical protein SUGI_0189370 [Cryptomeria japonica]|nr:hypothetical protein SUGI_0189370 [Cryptomeria japonica]
MIMEKKEMVRLCLQELRAVKVLGQGATGTVFLVINQKSDRPFALKVMRKCASGVVVTDRITGFLGEYSPGGNLQSLRLKQPQKTFPESTIRFYAAEIVIAVEQLHSQGIVHRDLKPENILIQASGHIMLIDFDLSTRILPKHMNTQKLQRSKLTDLTSILCCCFKASHSSEKTVTGSHSTPKKHNLAQVNPRLRSKSLVGTEEYVAPEMLQRTGHEFAVDWWALGILLYELLYGKTPFKGATRKDTYYNIINNRPQFTETWTPLKDLIMRLLQKEPSERLGSQNGAQDIKQHSFFKSLNWNTIHCVSRPPFLPLSRHSLDEHLINTVSTSIDIEESVEMKSSGKSNNTSTGFSNLMEKKGHNWVEELSKQEEILDFSVF